MGGSRNLGKKFPNRKQPERRETTHVRGDEEPEEALWRHVIIQAIDDATMPLTESRMKRTSVILDRQRAREWLLGNSERFRLACELAGAEIEQVRALARKLIEQADAQQRAAMNSIKATAMNLLANQQEQAAKVLAVTMPRVVDNFPMEAADRRTSVARECEKIEFSSQIDVPTQNQTFSASTSADMATAPVEMESKL